MIRTAVREDIDSIRRIYNDAVIHTTANFEDKPKTREEMEAWFEPHRTPYTILVDEIEGIIRGYVALSPFKNGKAVVSIYVNAACRNRGVGKTLLSELIRYASDREEFAMLIAFITQGNNASMKLLESVGFVPAGKLDKAGSKFGKELDVHLYRMKIKENNHGTVN